MMHNFKIKTNKKIVLVNFIFSVCIDDFVVLDESQNAGVFILFFIFHFPFSQVFIIFFVLKSDLNIFYT